MQITISIPLSPVGAGIGVEEDVAALVDVGEQLAREVTPP